MEGKGDGKGKEWSGREGKGVEPVVFCGKMCVGTFLGIA